MIIIDCNLQFGVKSKVADYRKYWLSREDLEGRGEEGGGDKWSLPKETRPGYPGSGDTWLGPPDWPLPGGRSRKPGYWPPP